MKKKDKKSGSVKIDPNVWAEAKEFCKQNGVLVSFYATEAVRKQLQSDKIKIQQS